LFHGIDKTAIQKSKSKGRNNIQFDRFAGKKNREAIFSASKMKKLEMSFRAGCDAKVQCQSKLRAMEN